MDRIKKHLLCLLVSLFPLWFMVIVYMGMGYGIDFSLLVPASLQVLNWVGPLADFINFVIGSWFYYLLLLLAMVSVYGLVYRAQKEEHSSKERWGLAIVALTMTASLAGYFFLTWVYVVYVLMPKIQEIGW
ncbi:MAG TPA: hypothetical protein PLD25_22825 [Chloroflexota bacterium]|nr:hypothetical protein [Chloroflexota bacterium]HUM71487.1 hypothetical protein [Chloroflexota bacterium]